MDSKELHELAKEYEECEDLEEAYRYYLEAALADDDGEAVTKLADMYLNGDYVDIDFDLCAGKEIKLLTRAACILGFLDEAANKK